MFLQAAHRLAVARLRADPKRIGEVQALLHRWREQSGPTRSDLYWDEWERLLAMPIDDFEAVITPSTFDRPELRFKMLCCQSAEKLARLNGVLTALPDEFGNSFEKFFGR